MKHRGRGSRAPAFLGATPNAVPIRLVANVKATADPSPEQAPSGVSQADPTRTTMLRRAFAVHLRAQFGKLKLALVKLVADEDVFGLTPRGPVTADSILGNSFCPTGKGGGIDPTCSPHNAKGAVDDGGVKYTLGRRGPKGELVDVPSDTIVRKAKEAVEAARTTLRAAGVSDEHLQQVQIFSDPTTGYHAIARGEGRLDLNWTEDNLKQMEVVFKESKEALLAGTAPIYGFTSLEDIVLHEVGHNVHRSLTPKQYAAFEEIFSNRGWDIKFLPSFYAQENSSEAFAESFMAWIKGKPFSGTAQHYEPPDYEIRDFVAKAATRGKSPTVNTRWQFRTDEDKLAAFKEWLKEQLHSFIKGKSEEDLWRAYITQGFRKGTGRAFEDSVGAGLIEDPTPATDPSLIGTPGGKVRPRETGRERFLRSSFNSPVSTGKLKLLVSRVFSDLSGVTDEMAVKMTRILADGLVRGVSPHRVAADLSRQLDISRYRAETVARTELIRAHAEGQLTALEQLGVTEVGVMVEWTTSGLGTTKKGNPSPCPLCAPLRKLVLTIAEARGMLPRHPNCLCAWRPANVGEQTDGQKRTKRQIEYAIKKSADAGGDNFRAGATIRKKRPEYVADPTGNEDTVPTPAPSPTENPIDRFSRLLAEGRKKQ